MQVFRRHDALETLVFLLGFRVKCGRGIVSYTIDPQRAFRVDLFRFVQESVIDDGLADVAFHVLAGLLLLFGVYQGLDHFEGGRVVQVG